MFGTKCPVCQKKFDNVELFVEHVNGSHGDNVQSDGLTTVFKGP